MKLGAKIGGDLLLKLIKKWQNVLLTSWKRAFLCWISENILFNKVCILTVAELLKFVRRFDHKLQTYLILEKKYEYCLHLPTFNQGLFLLFEIINRSVIYGICLKFGCETCQQKIISTSIFRHFTPPSLGGLNRG